MDFTLDQKHEMARDLFKQFAETEVKPLAQETDETEVFPAETVAKMGKYGFMGIPVPKEYGGQGCDPLTYVMCVEELSKVCGTTGVIVSAHTSLCIDPIMTFGTEEQKKKYVPDLASGKKIGAFGLTEPGAGTDAQGCQTKAVLDGDEWVLNGSKCFITNGKVADVYIIIAITSITEDKRGRKKKNFSAFIVDKGTPGFSFGTKEKKMGIRGSSTYELIFEDARIPKDALLGKEGRGFPIAMHTLDGGRIGIAAQALGIAEGALERTIEYTKQKFRLQVDGQTYDFNISFAQLPDGVKAETRGMIAWNASDYNGEPDAQIIKGLGHSQSAVLLPKGRTLTYEVYTASSGNAVLRTALLPGHAVNGGHLRYSVSVDELPSRIVAYDAVIGTEEWKINVLRGQTLKETFFQLDTPGRHIIRIKALDNDVVIDQLMLDFDVERKFYQFPVR